MSSLEDTLTAIDKQQFLSIPVFTQLQHKGIHCYFALLKAIHGYFALLKAIHGTFALLKAIHGYFPLLKAIHGYFPLLKAIHGYREMEKKRWSAKNKMIIERVRNLVLPRTSPTCTCLT